MNKEQERLIRIEEYRVLITQRSYSIMHFCEVLHTRFGWKNKSTGKVVWDKEEAIELITDEKKANKK
jgi:hypothetical protein